MLYQKPATSTVLISLEEQCTQAFQLRHDRESATADWRRLFAKIGTEPGLAVFRHLISDCILQPPSLKTVVSNPAPWLSEARNNPQAMRYPVSTEASELAEFINATETEIVPPEHVAFSMDQYRTLVGVVWSSGYAEVWVRIPPTRKFVLEWFTEVAVYGSLRMRLLTLRHPKFRKWFSGTCESVGVYEFEKLVDKALAMLEC
jgi:hypothetical protein